MGDLAGTGSLARLGLRRDRVLIPVWIGVFVLTAASSAGATADLYPTTASRVAAAGTINRSPALVGLYGRIYDPSSLGAVSIIKLGGFGALMVALLSVVVVVRHTRRDEESGRLELLGATAVGRLAPLAAALVVAVVLNVALGVTTSAGLWAAGLPLEGSLAFGAAWAGVGLAFAAVAAVCAQLTVSARSAIGLASAVLGVVYAIRAVGDAADAGGPRWLSWLSPIGWAQQFRPYAGNRWWVLGIILAFTVVMVLVAGALAARRDLGGGLLPERAGPARAPANLRSPEALAYRLQRGVLLAWLVAFVALGVLLGSIASSVGDMLSTPAARDFIRTLGGEQGLIDAFLAVEMTFAGIFAAAYGIQATSRLRSEEAGLRAEPLLAAPVGRLRWAGGHLGVALGGSAVLLVTAGLSAGVARAVVTGDGGQAFRLVGAAAAQLPAVWVLVGATLLLFGWAPRLTVGAWAVLVGFILIGEVAPLLDVGQWLLDLSPFSHVPRLPGGAFSAVPLVVLTSVALLLGGLGLWGVRRRDLT
ncbi:MAG: ABC transporter permease [Microthrixaceae bacterium]